MAATSILPIVIIASKARFASAPAAESPPDRALGSIWGCCVHIIYHLYLISEQILSLNALALGARDHSRKLISIRSFLA